MLKHKAKMYFLLLFIASLSSSCHGYGFELIEEKMYYDVSTNLRYQYVKFDSYEFLTGLYEGTVETNILDSFQFPNSFKFGEDNIININIPYDSLINNFYFEALDYPGYSWNARQLQRRKDFNNCINSRDDRRYYDSPSFCLRYGQNNGLISDIIETFTINLVFSDNFVIDEVTREYYDRDVHDGYFHLCFFFWDTLDNLDNYDYKTFDGKQFIEEMKTTTKYIRENDLIKINAYWENGNEIEDFVPLINLDYFYYGPPDPTYEIVV